MDQCEPIVKEAAYDAGEALLPYVEQIGDDSEPANKGFSLMPEIPSYVRTPDKAMQWAKYASDHNWWYGFLCLKFVHEARNVGSKYGDAITAWRYAEGKHYNSKPPKGAPYWYSIGAHGHIVLATGDGNCWSNDVVRYGHIDRISLGAPERVWGARRLGWAETLNGVRIYQGTVLDISVIQNCTRTKSVYIHGRALKRWVRAELKRMGVPRARMVDTFRRLGPGYRENAKRLQKAYGFNNPDGLLGRQSLERLTENQAGGRPYITE